MKGLIDFFKFLASAVLVGVFIALFILALTIF
ncbi:hypothetical protein [Caudoviricetes sp.]|nr:hypothetical protein [Caudoviricetes sp.]